MTETVLVNVYCDESGVIAVADEHRPELPKPFSDELQEWAESTFTDLEPGSVRRGAGVLEYEPNGEIIELRKA